MQQGQLFIVSAPSGAGKTSLISALIDTIDNVTLSTSHTTRSPRPNEVEGEQYYFIDINTFKQKIEDEDFIEHARVFDHYYGTSRSALEAQLEEGQDIILEIDWQGAEQIRQQLSCASIFILPPSRDVLVKRLEKRQQDSESVIQRRTREAQAEIFHYDEFDHIIINDDFDTALEELKAIVLCQRTRTDRQQKHHAQLLTQLLTPDG